MTSCVLFMSAWTAPQLERLLPKIVGYYSIFSDTRRLNSTCLFHHTSAVGPTAACPISLTGKFVVQALPPHTDFLRPRSTHVARSINKSPSSVASRPRLLQLASSTTLCEEQCHSSATHLASASGLLNGAGAAAELVAPMPVLVGLAPPSGVVLVPTAFSALVALARAALPNLSRQ